MTVAERICEVEGCGNLGKKSRNGRREPLCHRHRRERWPNIASRGEKAARQLLRGGQILNQATHHNGIRLILGATRGDGLTASRTCPDDCPHSWLGYDYKGAGEKVEYRLCIPEHYVMESQATNNARKVAR